MQTSRIISVLVQPSLIALNAFALVLHINVELSNDCIPLMSRGYFYSCVLIINDTLYGLRKVQITLRHFSIFGT